MHLAEMTHMLGERTQWPGPEGSAPESLTHSEFQVLRAAPKCEMESRGMAGQAE